MQAVVITAYKSFEQLQELAELLSKKFLVYIHVDRRIPSEKYNPLKIAGGGGYTGVLTVPCELGRLEPLEGNLISYA